MPQAAQQFAGFTLREEHAGTVTVYPTVEDQEKGEGREVPRFQGGVIAADGNGTSFDLAKELERNDGTIVVPATNLPLLDTLERHPALKRVQLPDDFEPVTGYAGLNRAQLRDALGDVPGVGRAKAEDLRAALELRDQAIASGDQAAADDPIGALKRQAETGGDAGDGETTTEEG